uniref:heat shock cognate 70 kDa protein-like n=1 Tax=Erigeron canadensis TaxID=72917 RepID=UPI001CB98C04|nr:heat shock cognate 70 kDa protein-like [Erigeron canadensis]
MSRRSRRGKEAIGIDLGTTYSCVAVWKNDRVEIIPNDQGNRTTPSAVAFTDADCLIGDSAKNQLLMNPTNTIFGQYIGRNYTDFQEQQDIKLWPFEVIRGPGDAPKIVVTYKGQKKEFMAQEISSMILGKLKATAEAYLGEAVENAVITVPAYFNESQHQATKDAGTIAGLNVIRMINEPTAAALTYGLDNKLSGDQEINVLIFDLGSGTFDVSLLTIDQRGGHDFKVKAVSGDTHLGGEDFDNLMVDHCVDYFKRRWKNKDLTGNQRALGRLRASCEKAKRILSSTTETSIELDCLHEGIDFSMKFTRAKFENLNMSMFNSCITTVDRCLKDAGMEKSGVDEIVLVGGSTRIPMVQCMLQEYFDGKQLCKSVNADEAVAYGAAIMAAKLSSGGTSTSLCLRDLVLVDVTPLSLGVRVAGDVFSVVIQRNTSIPFKREGYLMTSCDDQYALEVKVYQGERARATDNHFLGKFKISGIPPAPKGVSIWTCFDIDADGLLTVTAKIESTGNTEQLIIKNENRRLSMEGIEKMIKDADKYKHEDQEFKRRADAYMALEDYLYDLKNMMKTYDYQERAMHPNRRKRIQNAIAYTTTWLLENQAACLDELQDMMIMLKSNIQRFTTESTRRNQETDPRRGNEEVRNQETNLRGKNQETGPRQKNQETEPRPRYQKSDPRPRNRETEPRARNKESDPRGGNQETGPTRKTQETEPRWRNQESDPRPRNQETNPRQRNQKKLSSWLGGLLYGLKDSIQRRFY